jgi:hypothetical protein
MSKNFYAQAIAKLKPGCAWGLSPADELIVDSAGKIINLNWESYNTSPPPSVEEIEAAAIVCEQEHNASLYKKERERLYPSLADLADAIYWQSKGDNSKMETYLASVEQVKQDIPKS